MKQTCHVLFSDKSEKGPILKHHNLLDKTTTLLYIFFKGSRFIREKDQTITHNKEQAV